MRIGMCERYNLYRHREENKEKEVKNQSEQQKRQVLVKSQTNPFSTVIYRDGGAFTNNGSLHCPMVMFLGGWHHILGSTTLFYTPQLAAIIAGHVYSLSSFMAMWLEFPSIGMNMQGSSVCSLFSRNYKALQPPPLPPCLPDAEVWAGSRRRASVPHPPCLTCDVTMAMSAHQYVFDHRHSPHEGAFGANHLDGILSW